jgi:hypothetical protein
MPPANTYTHSRPQNFSASSFWSGNAADKAADASTPRKSGEEARYHVGLFGKTYDVTDFVHDHPGGQILTLYDGLDATNIFQSLHGKEAFQLLKDIPHTNERIPSIVDEKTQKENKKLLDMYAQLKKDVTAAGLFKRNYPWIVYKMVTTVAILVLSVLAVQAGWYWTSSLLAGVFWQQIGWMGHDFCHHGYIENRDIGNWMVCSECVYNAHVHDREM